MTKQEWIDVALTLVAQSRRSLTGWESDFSEKELAALAAEWNKDKSASDEGFWMVQS